MYGLVEDSDGGGIGSNIKHSGLGNDSREGGWRGLGGEIGSYVRS